MGLLDAFINAVDSVLGSGSSNSGSGDDVRIEGRESHPHTHEDGNYGPDIYAARVSYRDGTPVAEEKAGGYGHISVNSKTGDGPYHKG